MSSFDSEKYFAQRARDISSRAAGNPPGDIALKKMQDVANATQRKQADFLGKFADDLEQKNVANEGSWVSRLGLRPNSVTADAVNLGASVASGTARVLGHAASAAVGLAGTLASGNKIDEKAYEAFARYQSGNASAEDMALLSSHQAQYDTDGTPIDAGPNTPTIGELITQEGAFRAANTAISKATDFSGLVHSGNRDELNQDIKQDFSESWSQVKDGWDASKNGDPNDYSGELNMVHGLGKLILNAGKAAFSNPIASAEYIAENLPQVALGAAGLVGKGGLAASNAGYAYDTYEKGITDYQKANNGKLPSEAEREKMALYAASLAVAEHVGDVTVLKGLFPGSQGAKNAARAGLKTSLQAAAKAGGKGAATEAATEGYQTFGEGEAQLKPASAEDIYVGATIGGIAGGGLSAGGTTLSEAGKGVSQIAESAAKSVNERAAEKALITDAIEKGDVTPFLDKEAKTYDPAKAIQVLHGNSKKEDTPEETKKANLKKAAEIVAGLEKDLEETKDNSKLYTKEGLEANIVKIQEKIAGLDPEKPADAERLVKLNSALTKSQENLAQVDNEEGVNKRKQMAAEIEAIEANVQKSRTLVDELNSEFSPKAAVADPVADVTLATKEVDTADTEAVKASQASAERVITLSMESPDQITPEAAKAIAANPSNNLSPAQRTYLRQFSEAREASHGLMTMGDVSKAVYTGKGKDVGIAQYRKRLAHAVANKDSGEAAVQLKGIRGFAADHASKAEKAKEAWSKGKGRQIGRARQGLWEILSADKRISDPKERKKHGVLELNSGDLVGSIATEAAALNAAVAEMQSLFDMNFGEKAAATPSPVAKKTVEPVVDSQSTEAAPAASSTQNPVETAKGELQSNVDVSTETEESVDKTEEPTVEATSTNTAEPSEDVLLEEDASIYDFPETHEDSDPEHRSGELSVMKDVSPEGTPYELQNLIAEFFTQSEGEPTDVFKRPLAAIRDFLSVWIGKDSLVEKFVEGDGGTWSNQQKDLLNYFQEKATRWRTLFNQQLGDPVRQEFFNRDMSLFLREKDADGKVLNTFSENVTTAMTYALFSYVADNGSKPARNTPEAINKILNRREEHPVSPREQELFGFAGNRRNTVAADLGKKVVQALGLKPTKDAPKNLLDRLETDIGIHVLNRALEFGVLQQNIITVEELSSTDSDLVFTEDAHMIRFSRQPDSVFKLSNNAQALVDVQKKTGMLLDKLFGVESDLRMPTLKPVPFNQKTTQGTNQSIPKRLQAVLKQKNKEANFIDYPAFLVLSRMPEHLLNVVLGVEETSEEDSHVINRESIEAKNQGLILEFDRLADFVENTLSQHPDGIDGEFFFQHDVWVNQRVGIESNTVNPQASKIHRFLVFRKDWETEIDPTNAESMKQFKLRVMEGFGVNTGAQSNATTLSKYEGKVGNPAIQKAVDALVKTVVENQQVTPALANLIAEGVKVGGENVHTYSALVALAQEKAAQGKPFKVRLMSETDGVASGPTIGTALFGAAASVKDMFTSLARGGFFHKDAPIQAYNKWREQDNNLDLYENMAKVLDGLARKAFTENRDAVITYGKKVQKVGSMRELLSSIFAISESLTEIKNGQRTASKAGRNFVKFLVRPVAFGSSTKRAIDSMAEGFIESAYEKMEQSKGKSVQERAVLLQHINKFLPSNARIPLNISHKELLNTKFSPYQEAHLKKLFRGSLGLLAEETLKETFSEFTDKRDSVNQMTQIAHSLYESVYTPLRNQFIEELIQKELEEKGTGIPSTIVRGERVAIRDLTPKEEKELNTKLVALHPVMHTMLSQQEGNLDAGLAVPKTEKRLAVSNPYRSEVRVKTTRSRKGTRGYTNTSFSRGLTSPGVRMASFSTHSSDSAISHIAGILSQVLNIHDAHGAGIGTIVQAARNLNQATWEVLLNYSPLEAASQSLNATIRGMAEMLSDPDVSEEVKKSVEKAIDKLAVKYEVPPAPKGQDSGPAWVLRYIAVLAKVDAFNSDRVRLGFLSELGTIDQYAMEDGGYQVTDADRAEAKAKLAKLTGELDPATIASIEAIAKIFKNEVAPSAEAAVQPLGEHVLTRVSPVEAVQIVEQLAQDASLSETLRSIFGKLKEYMLEHKSSIRDAIQAVVTAPDISSVVSLINNLHSKIPEDLTSPWGEVGKPLYEFDAELAAALAAEPVLSATKALRMAYRRLRDGNAPKPFKDFNLRLISRLSQLVPEDIQVKYVTRDTPIDAALSKPEKNSRGWYSVTTDGKKEIYILSDEHVHSMVSPEVVIHEILHAVLNDLIKSPTKEANKLIGELESLRGRAVSHLGRHPELSHLSPATKNIDEFISWGMSNREFQDKVLKKLTMKSAAKPVSGLTDFIRNLVGLVFGKTKKSEEELLTNGLGILITNTALLFEEVGKNAPKSPIATTLSQESPDPIHRAKEFSSLQILAALNRGGVVDSGVMDNLGYLLDRLVSKLDGPFGVFKAQLKANTGISAVDMFQKFKDDGMTPFASSVLASSLVTPEPVAFVLEQVEATVRAAISGTNKSTAAYTELSKLFVEARKLVKPEHFYDGDWSTATAAEIALAEEQHSFVFDIVPGTDDKSNHLAQFAALGLAHPKVHELLKVATAVDTRRIKDGKTFIDRLQIAFEKLLEFFSGKLTKTFGGQQADEKLTALVTQLVGIEAKRRRALARQALAEMPSLERGVKNLAEKVREKIGDISEFPILRKNQLPFVGPTIRAGSGVVSLIARDRVELMMDLLTKQRDKLVKGRLGLAAGIINEVKGVAEGFQVLLRGSKEIEKHRKFLINQTGEFLRESFISAGSNLSRDDRSAVTSVFLRTDLSALLDTHSLAQIRNLLTNRTDLYNEIKSLKSQLAQFKGYDHFFIKSAHVLGYSQATGAVKGTHLLRNARNIADMVGTANQGALSAQRRDTAEALIDRLATLYALQHTGTRDKTLAAAVFDKELSRTDKGNGVEAVLLQHKLLQKESKERLFNGSEALYTKGYTPEIYNPRTEIVVADEVEGAGLVGMGYSKGAKVAADPADPDKTVKHIYVLKEAGLGSRQSGMLSLTSEKAAGALEHGLNTNPQSATGIFNNRVNATIAAAKRAEIQSMFNPDPSFDPSKVSGSFLAPVLNPAGDVVNYRYMMLHSTRDAVLERENSFDKVMGTLAGNTYDKEVSPEHNLKVVQALRDHYNNDYAGNPDSFLTISLTSQDPELREIYRLLPEKTKQHIRSVWGRDEIRVHNAVADLAFGYRKLGVGEVFKRVEEDRRAAKVNAAVRDTLQAKAERALVEFSERAVRLYALGVNSHRAVTGKKELLDVDTYVRRTAVLMRRNEEVWQEMVKEVKDFIVVKSWTVLQDNILSNLSLLVIHGVPLKSLFRDHTIAMKGVLAHQRESAQLHRLEQQMSSGYTLGNDKEIQQEILRLRDSLARNPVKPLIDAGLMPTIVEDVQVEDDIYSYKSRLARKVSGFTDKLHPKVTEAGRFLYMSHDTKLYQGLSHLTQMSDFVARYTLYQHLTNQGKDSMSHEDAIHEASESFVNYDIPSHRGMQYLDDSGAFMFTKYFLRIQRVLLKLARNNPARLVSALLLNNMMSTLPLITDASALTRFGNNPFNAGAFQIPGAMAEAATIKSGLWFFK